MLAIGAGRGWETPGRGDCAIQDVRRLWRCNACTLLSRGGLQSYSTTLQSLARGGLAVILFCAAGVQGAAGEMPKVGVVLYAAACCGGGGRLAVAGIGCSKGGRCTSSLLLCSSLLLYVDTLNAQPDKGRSPRGWNVHLGDEVEGGEDIGNVIQTPHLGLELVDVIRRIVPTCSWGKMYLYLQLMQHTSWKAQ